jgi:hypothetical protein
LLALKAGKTLSPSSVKGFVAGETKACGMIGHVISLLFRLIATTSGVLSALAEVNVFIRSLPQNAHILGLFLITSLP